MIRKIITFLFKALILYLAFIVLFIDLIMMETALPRSVFLKIPFFYSWAIVLSISAVISYCTRSRTPLLWGIFCPAFSVMIFIVFARYATLFTAFFLVVAAVSFIYRNKITEPFLILLPILAGAWIFLQYFYLSYVVSWSYYITGKKPFREAVFEGLASVVNDQGLQMALVTPIVAMYFIGNHGYRKLYPIYSSLQNNKRFNSNEL